MKMQINDRTPADMEFLAIDVETANADMASICQIGMAFFSGGKLVEEWSTLVDPETDFHSANVAVHGIGPSDVAGQPKLPQIAHQVRCKLEGATSVCHTPFDRVALERAYDRYGLRRVSTAWLDSAQVVRRTWKDLAWRGYGLTNVCKRIGYSYRPHDALEDAKAAGHVLLAAIQESGRSLEHWRIQITQPIDDERPRSPEKKVGRDGDPQGAFYGEILVFTGQLSLPRGDAADLASRVGCKVTSSVTSRTTILVVGDQDMHKLAGHEKSTKHRRAEQLAAEGQRIRIIRESDFKILVAAATIPPEVPAATAAAARYLTADARPAGP